MKIINLIATTTLFFTALPLQAAEQLMDGSTAYVSGMLGGNLPNGDSRSSTSPLMGLSAGVKATPAFGLGFFGTYYGQRNQGSIYGLTAGTETQTYNLCGELNYFVSIFHAGIDVGASINSWSASAGNASLGTSNSVLVYGPQAGVGIPLGNSGVSAGASAHYLFNDADNSQNNLLLLADLTVWL